MLKTKDGLNLFTERWQVAAPRAIVVLTHGFGEYTKRYSHVAAALNAGGYSVYAYDLRGRGRSEGTRGHTPSYEAMLDDLQTACGWAGNENPGQKIFLYGHSTGGQISLNYAIRRRPPVAGVLVTGPWFRLAFATPPWKRVAGRVLSAVRPTFAMPKGIEKIPLSHDTAFLNEINDAALSCNVITARMAVEMFKGCEEALARANELRVPVLLLHGGEDKLIAPSATQTFYDRLTVADKTLVFYEGMYHEITNEVERARVFKDMLAWLDKHSSSCFRRTPVSKRQQLRERRQRQTQRQRLIAIGGIVVVALAVVGWLIYQNFRPVGSYVSVTSTPPPNSDGSAIGSPDAKVVVTAYEDFQCPNCGNFTRQVEGRLFEEYVYTGKIRYDYAHFIVIDRGGSESRHAAEASECAAAQGWFWPYHEMLFANQTAENVGDFADKRLKAFAGALALDQQQFDSCLDAGKFSNVVTGDVANGRSLGVSGTPTLIIPGAAPIVGTQDYTVYQQAIEAALTANP
ncbi:MAG: alpha/beta fold hydrolase [Chloroflexota bacterium]